MTTTVPSLTPQEIVAKVVSGNADLPVLPATAVKVMQELRAPGISVPRLIKQVELDPALTAAVLRVANSAFYGSQVQLRDLKAAISSIGMKQTRNLLYALVLRSKMADAGAYGHHGAEVFEHSLAVAFGSRLVTDVAAIEADDAFLCGILHDVGKLALVQALRVNASGESHELDEADNALVEEHHAETGALLAEHWGLPPSVSNVIRYHHAFESADAPQPTTACVALANALCHEVGLGGQSVPAVAFEAVSAAFALKLSSEQLATIREKLPAAVEPATAMFRG